MKFRVGDTVMVVLKGVVGYGETGTVIDFRELLPEYHAEASFNTVSVKLSTSGFTVRYSEGCLEKVGTWRSIDDTWNLD